MYKTLHNVYFLPSMSCFHLSLSPDCLWNRHLLGVGFPHGRLSELYTETLALLTVIWKPVWKYSLLWFGHLYSSQHWFTILFLYAIFTILIYYLVSLCYGFTQHYIPFTVVMLLFWCHTWKVSGSISSAMLRDYSW